MSKSKPSKAVKPTKSDVLTKAKDAAVAKPAQNVKAKSKELAKQVVAKEEKKNKKSKKVKEPTPEPSDSEDSESSESESSASESEEVSKPVANGKASGTKKAVVTKDDSESDASDSDSDESSGDEAPKVNGADKKTAAVNGKATKPVDDSDDSASDSDDSADEADPVVDAASSDDDSDDSADDSSEDEKPTKAVAKAVEIKKSVKASAKSTDSDSAEDSDEGSDSSDESEDEEEKKPAPKTTKRKAEEDPSQTVKKTKTEALDTSKGANLFVGNLSWNVDEAWLKEVFEEFGEVSGVRIMTDRATGRSKGFGYVEFVNAEDAAQAHAAKQGADLDNRAMNVDFANARPDNSQKQENRRKSYGDSVSEPSDTLFIGNLSFDVGQETVTEAFQPHGTILGIRLPTDRETGQPKGFGYVTFASIDEATSAMAAMQGAYIESRPVRLDYSSPRPQNNDSPAGGRGGFGGRGGGRGGPRGGRGGRGGSFGGGRGGRGGGRGGSTNRGGFGDFSGRKTSFD